MSQVISPLRSSSPESNSSVATFEQATAQETPDNKPLNVVSCDSHPVSVRLFKPVESPKAVLLLGHAMMTNSTSMDKPRGQGFASYLTEQGFLCYMIDARGRGGSGLPAIKGNDWSYDDLMLKDLPAAINVIRQRHPTEKFMLVGHSLFGHGALGLLGKQPETPLDGVVCFAANVWIPRLDNNIKRRIKKRAQLGVFNGFALAFKRFPARKLKFGNEDEAKTYTLSFLKWWKRDCWETLDGSWNYLTGLANVKVPVLAIAGAGDDLMCHPECSEKFMSHLTGATLTHRTFGIGDDGLSFNPGHMDLITSTKSKPVWEYAAQWISNTNIS